MRPRGGAAHCRSLALRAAWHQPGTPPPAPATTPTAAPAERLRAREQPASACRDRRRTAELDRLPLEDAVRACQDGPETEEVRRLLVLRDVEPDSGIPGYDTYRVHPEHPSHAHPDIAALFAGPGG
ncbi:hypothetical protein [Streptomyces sp. NPDC047028]|uniref:hypothetical protein n=1 Tax=Streptomyces sp. NPDC047028 TaxID=3155793 RepID=UPI003402D59E